MAFTPQTINKELDMANLAKHNANYSAIKTELDAHDAHIVAQTAHGSTSEAVAGKIVQRDSAGRAKVAAPAAADDIARKAEVDAVQSDLNAHKADRDVHLSAADRAKFDGIEDGAQPNQNAFAKVNNVEAGAESDALTIAGGTGITVSTNPGTKTVTVTATGTATPGPHGESHDIGGADPIPDLVALRSEFDALTPADIGAETPAAAQAKVDALAGAGNTKTVVEVAAQLANLAIHPKAFGARGDEVTNDTNAFNDLEVAHKGIVVDMLGGTYLVDSIPNKNSYFNGVFKLESNTRPALVDTFASGVPKFHSFGGQLRKLKESLCNPLEQITGIVFVGDSITWGAGLEIENGSMNPSDGRLTDPRDIFLSPSYVNTFKRYIGRNYAGGAAQIVSNWPISMGGESTIEFTKEYAIFPQRGDFSITTVAPNGSLTVDEEQEPASPTKYGLVLGDGDSSGAGYHKISFRFTGDSLTLAFKVTNDFTTFYDLIVDGVKIGTYSARPGEGGFVAGNNQQRTHTFGYVRDKLVEIRSNRNGETGLKYLNIQGVIIKKKIRITNQGLNGQSALGYREWAMPDAIRNDDNFVFVQLGTNDRISYAWRPDGSNEFKHNLKNLVDMITPRANTILMCSCPARNEDPSLYSFNMQEVRNAIYGLAKSLNLDMIDNYTAWFGLSNEALTSDGLHPNNVGHQIIARNIIGALEMA